MNIPIRAVPLVMDAQEFQTLASFHEAFISKQDMTLSSIKEQYPIEFLLLFTVIDRSLQQASITLVKDKPIFQTLQLIHADRRILNLPWVLVFAGFPFIDICKGFHPLNDPDNYLRPQIPIRVLFILSFPFDTKEKLSYEREYKMVYNAMLDLLKKGKAYVDILEEGSLEKLEHLLKKQHYDILHYVGHSDGRNQALMEIENASTLKSEFVSYEHFAAIVSRLKRIPLAVYLSSCTTATAMEGSQSACQHLLDVGVPYVVAMGNTISDSFAVEFSAAFYYELTQSLDFIAAFNQAVRQTNSPEGYAAEITTPSLFISPQLLSKPLESRITEEVNTLDVLFGKFVGRTQELRQLTRLILLGKIINVFGPPGTGRLTLVKEALQRLHQTEHRITPIYLDSNSETILLERLSEAVATQQGETESNWSQNNQQFVALLGTLTSKCQPVIVISETEVNFSPTSAIQRLLEYRELPFSVVLITPVKVDQVYQFESIGLDVPDFVDFYRICSQFQVLETIRQRAIQTEEVANDLYIEDAQLDAQKYKGLIHLLYEYFEGSYTRLRELNKFLLENYSLDTITGIDVYREVSKGKFHEEYLLTDPSIQHHLAFIAALAENELAILEILHRFGEPVERFAFGFFFEDDQAAILQRLEEKLLIKVFSDTENGLSFYGITKFFEKKVTFFFSERPATFESQIFSELAARYYEHLLQFYPGRAVLRRIVELYLATHNTEKLNVYGPDLIHSLYVSNELDDVVSFCDQLIPVFEAISDNNALLLVYPIWGHALKQKRRYQEALVAQQSHLKSARSAGKKLDEAIAFDNIGQLCSELKEYDEALTNHQQALRIFEELADKKHEAICLANMAALYHGNGDFEHAVIMWRKVIELLELSWETKQLESAYHGLATSYLRTAQFELALQFFDKSIKLLLDSGE